MGNSEVITDLRAVVDECGVRMRNFADRFLVALCYTMRDVTTM